MLELLGSGLVSLWLQMAGVQIQPVETLNMLAWPSSPSLILAPDPNPEGAMVVQEYLKELLKTKLVPQNLLADQGIWIQSGPMLVANHEGTTPLPAASLTKIATSLVSFKTWGPDHQFETLISATGPITNGTVQGDLVITGGHDPLFVGEEAIAISNALHKLGIKQIKGNLVIVGNFAMDFQHNPLLAGQLFKRVVNYKSWSRRENYEYSLMPKGTPKPQLLISGTVKVEQPLQKQTLLIRHQSLPLKQLLKEMNVYSNNDMAEILAQSVGGAQVVRATAAQIAGVPDAEIQLINGSGLGTSNQISPRAICAMLIALEREALSHGLTLTDLFAMSGFDHRGTIHARHLPIHSVVKTGTLNSVSSLAGVIPTRDRGLVWFAIINRGSSPGVFRSQQDKLLQHLIQALHVADNLPTDLTPHSAQNSLPKLGATERNTIVYPG